MPDKGGGIKHSKSVDAPNAYRVSTSRATGQCDKVIISHGNMYTQLNQYLLKDEIGKVSAA